MEQQYIFIQASKDKENLEISQHSHFGVEIILVSNGRLNLTVAGKNYDLGPRQMAIIPPETLHEQKVFESVVLSFISFRCTQPENFDTSCRIMDLSNEYWACRLFQEICEMSERCKYYLCESMIATLVLELKTITEKEKFHVEFHPALREAVEKIENRFFFDWSMEQLAFECKVSVPYLRKLFERQFKMSPQKYLQNCRMANARRMLLDNWKNVAEIGRSCGYKDSAYFTRLFRKLHNCTPSQYRWIIQNRSDASGINL